MRILYFQQIWRPDKDPSVDASFGCSGMLFRGVLWIWAFWTSFRYFQTIFSREPPLHRRVCPPIRPSVRPSVRLSVHWSVRNALTRRAETGRRAAYVGYTNLLLVFCELNKCITEQWIGGPMDGSLNRPMDGSRDGPTDEMMDTLLVGQMDGPMNGPVVG